jgi:hypothetical protein
MRKGICIGFVISNFLIIPAVRIFGNGFGTTARTEFPQNMAVKRDAAPIATAVSCTIDVEGIGPSEYGQHELHDVRLTVLEVVRGDKAWEIIKAADAANKPADTGLEYFLVRVRFEYSVQGSQGSIPYTMKQGCFKLYSADNKNYPIPSVTSPKPELIGREFYAGSSYEGWMPFVAAINDNPTMFYTAGSVWFRF